MQIYRESSNYWITERETSTIDKPENLLMQVTLQDMVATNHIQLCALAINFADIVHEGYVQKKVKQT